MIFAKELIIYALCFVGLFSSLVLLITFFENKHKLNHPKLKRFPLVSILVPAFNEEKTIAKSLKSLLKLDYPKDKIEIIVLDDGSADSTFAKAKEFAAYGIKAFSKKNSGKADTLNYGLARCKGEIVGALDADSYVLPDALKKMLPYFEEDKVMCVVPSVKIWKPKGILQRIQMIEFLSAAFIRKAFSYLGGVPVTPGPFTLYKKKFFDMHGGYDTNTLTEDIEVALRIESHRYTIESVIDAQVYTDPVSGLAKVYHQRLRWFKGFIDNIWRYRKLITPSYGNLGVFILPVSIFSILLGLTVFGYSMTKLVARIIQNSINFYLVGFDFSTWFDYSFDLFFVNTGSLLIIPVIALVFAVSFIILAKKYSKEKQNVFMSTALFFGVYWALYSVCWVSAAAHSAFKKSISWRRE